MEWRKERLEALAKAIGGRPALAKLMGHANDSYIGQMIRGGRPITEKTVNLAEEVTGKFGWFLVGREDGAGKSNRYAAPAEAAGDPGPATGIPGSNLSNHPTANLSRPNDNKLPALGQSGELHHVLGA